MSTQTVALPELIAVSIDELHEHPLNARRTFHPETMKELEQSIREIGIKTPLLVRANGKKGGFQIIGGHRRYRCAKEIGLAEVPVLVQQLDDERTLELMLIDNLQREGLHELEEAEGYRTLMTKAGYSVERIAEKVGRSIKYVYDRVKLLQLIPALQKVFRDGEITAGHAIIIARLAPADQKRLLDPDEGDYSHRLEDQPPLFENEDSLFPPDDDTETRKAISVRELQAWVDKNVRMEAAQVDPMLFPETVDTLRAAEDDKEKVVRITYDDITPEAAKDGPRPILGRSWKRADGKDDSKTCEHSVIGMVVIGPARGETFRVCADKKKCKVHWAEYQHAAKHREREAARGGTSSESSWQAQQRRYEEQQKRDAEARARWNKALPAILQAVATAVKKAPAGATGQLADILLGAIRDSSHGNAGQVPRGKSAEDLVRHAAFLVLASRAQEHWSRDRFEKRAKAIGVDVAKILNEVAPAPKPEAATASKKSRKK